MSIVYFAHSYRKEDARVVDFFGRLLRSEGLTPSLDPPSTSVNSAKLQRHLNASDGMVAVLSKRPGGTSSHILFEISLAVKVGAPLLVFVEDTIHSSAAVSNAIPQARFSARWFLREVREHRHAVRAFKDYLREYSQPEFRPPLSRRTCIVAGLGVEEMDVREQLAAWLSDHAAYDPQMLDDVSTPYQALEAIRNANLAVAFRDSPPTYVNGLIDGVGIPTIVLEWGDARPFPAWPPPEYLPRSVRDVDALKRVLGAEIALFEEDFLDLEDQADVDRYTGMLVDLGERHVTQTREQIKELVMGDKYVSEGNVVGAFGPNAHVHDLNFNQVWTSFAEKETTSMSELAVDLERLRTYLRSTAESRDDDAEVAAIGAAASAAEAGDGPGVMTHLSKVGKWALGAATSIGTALATAAIKHATGI